MCAFPLLSSAGERLVATKDSPPLWNRCLGGKLLLGKEKSQKHFSFGQANYSANICIICLCGGYKVADSLLKVLKILMVVLHPCKGVWGYACPQENFGI